MEIDYDTGEVISERNTDLYNRIVEMATPLFMYPQEIDRNQFGVLKEQIKSELKMQMFKDCLGLALL